MCVPVEWSVFVLRVLSELSLVLLVQESDGTEKHEGTDEEKEKREQRTAQEIDEGSQILTLLSKSLLSRLVWDLSALLLYFVFLSSMIINILLWKLLIWLWFTDTSDKYRVFFVLRSASVGPDHIQPLVRYCKLTSVSLYESWSIK